MSAKRKPVFPSSPKMRDDLNIAHDALNEIRIAIWRQVVTFTGRCQMERKELRSTILAEAISLAETSSSTVVPETSPCFLAFRFHKGALDVYWLKVIFTSGPRKKIIRRVEQEKGLTSLHALFVDAHPDEVATIRRHEEQARMFRAQWKEYAELVRKLKSFADAHLPA